MFKSTTTYGPLQDSPWSQMAHGSLNDYHKELTSLNKKLVIGYILRLNGKGAERGVCHFGLVLLAEMDNMSPDKQSRWIGYMQKSLQELGTLQVDEERDKTREAYNKLSKKFNFPVKSIDVGDYINKILEGDLQ